MATRIGIWVDIEHGVRPMRLDFVPHRSRAVVILMKDVGFSVSVEVAHPDNVPTGPRIAKVEACGVGASSVVAHDLVARDCQLPDGDGAVVILEYKICTRIINKSADFREVS